MAKKPSIDHTQQSFETLLFELNEKPGTAQKLQMCPEDIGGELLPILSKGLYTDPMHCIREYIQNSVDAGASQVIIKITGNSVLIHDNGKGMSLSELVQARQFGISTKDKHKNVGFRGIGIYSGFDLCNRLLITTKKAGEDFASVLEFDFAAMKKQLAIDAQISDQRTSLATLLEAHSRFSREDEVLSSHYTTVQLEDISDVHINRLPDRMRLRNYVLRNIPIDFDEAFEHREQINKQIKQHIEGYTPVKVVLESDDAPREVVVKPIIPNLDVPILKSVSNSRGEEIAFIWACLRKPPPLDFTNPPSESKVEKRGKIPEQYSAYSGFVYKVKGFTIGDNEKLRKEFKIGNSGLYWWYTGEIYVLDNNVIPNTERNDFETNLAYDALKTHVGTALRDLEKKAGEYRETELALEKFIINRAKIESIKKKVSENNFERADTYTEIDRALDELKGRKSKLAHDQRAWGQEVINDAEKIKKQIGILIDKPQSAKKERSKAANRRDQPDAEDFPDTYDDVSLRDADRQRDEEGNVTDRSATTSSQSGISIKGISETIQDSGWALPEDSIVLIEVIDRAIADVLGSESESYRAVVAQIEAKLAIEAM